MSTHGFRIGDLDDQSLPWVSSGVASKNYVDQRFAEFEAALQDTLLILSNDQVPEEVRKKALAVLQRIRRGSGGDGPKKIEIDVTFGHPGKAP